MDGTPIRYSADGQWLYVWTMGRTGLVYRVDVASGSTEVALELRPADPAGVVQIGPVAITADGEAYAYGYERALSQLVVVTGLD